MYMLFIQVLVSLTVLLFIKWALSKRQKVVIPQSFNKQWVPTYDQLNRLGKMCSKSTLEHSKEMLERRQFKRTL